MGVYVSLASIKHVALTPRKWAAMAGITFIAAVIIGGSLQLGDITLPTIASTPRQIAVGILGGILVLSSFVIVESARLGPKPGSLGDPNLWLKVFDAMPPAFIKEYPVDAHLTDNQPLRIFQGEKPSDSDETSELQTLINADHRHGDRIAFTNGTSVQLELSDRVPTKYPQLILTFKRRIEHDGRSFIVGWYIPIDRPDGLFNSTNAEFRNRGEQILFRLPASSNVREDSFVVDVGKAVRSLNSGDHSWLRRRR